MSIAIVVPTIREDNYNIFREKWVDLVIKHKATLLAVHDGDEPYIAFGDHKISVDDVMGKDSDLIYNRNDGIRNLGFAYISKYMPEVDVIITMDDDVYPNGNDPIQEHVDALNMRVPISWLSTASEYMRGFPYGIRDEAEVVLSHGVWEGVRDYDAPTQLVNGNKLSTFYRGVIPKGCMYPMCIMNVAFKRKMIPYMYQAPMGYRIGMDRFADIWSGITAKKAIDEKGWAVVSGYSTIYHSRASNVFTNLQKEAKGLLANETFWRDGTAKGYEDYFKLYKKQLKRWQRFVKE